MFVCVLSVVDGGRHEDKVDLSQSSSRLSPPKPVARRTKAAPITCLNEMILRRHTAMFQRQNNDASSSRVDGDAQLKPPIPIFRPKKQQMTSGETDKQTAGPSELAAVNSRIHRRTDSDSIIETVRSEKPAEIPSVKTVTFQRTQKLETVQTSSPLPKPTSAQKSILSLKQSVKEETPDDITRRTEASEQPEKKSLTAAEADKQPVAVDEVEKRPTKPQLPPKTGVLSQKAEHALKTNHPRVVKPSLSLPASTITAALPAIEDSSVEEIGNKFRIPEVKLRSTSPLLKTPVTLTSELVHSDSALNTVVLESAGSTEKDGVVRGKNGQEHGSAEQLAPGSLKTVSAESELGRKWSAKKNRAGIVLKNGDLESDETEMTKESGKDTTNSSQTTVTGQTTSSHQTAAVPESTQSETISRRPQECSRSEQGQIVKTEAGRPENRSAGTTRQQKSSLTAAADKGPEADKPSLTDECDTADTFVPVSKRATMFGSSLLSSGRQSSVKPASSVQVDVSDGVSNAGELSRVTRSVASRVASIAACSTDRQPPAARNLKTSVTTTGESNIATETSACEAKNEVVIQAADVGRCPPPTQSDKVSIERPPLKTTAVKSVTGKLSANVGTSAGKQLEKPDEKTSAVTGVVQKAPDKTSAPSWVKQSRTFSSKHQPKEGSGEPVLKKDNAESGSIAVVSSVPSWVKPLIATSPKHARKNSPQENSVTSSSCSVQSVSGGSKDNAESGSTAVMSSVPSWVKPSLTTSPKQARKNSPQETSVTSSSCSVQSVSGGSKDNAESGRTAVVSSVPSWVKPSVATSPKQARKNSPQETSVTSSSCSVQSQPGTAASAKTTTSVTVETKTGVSKVKSTSVKDPAVERGTVKPSESVVVPQRRFAAGKQPVTSGEPIWMSLAQKKSRVWTEGKISSE